MFLKLWNNIEPCEVWRQSFGLVPIGDVFLVYFLRPEFLRKDPTLNNVEVILTKIKCLASQVASLCFEFKPESGVLKKRLELWNNTEHSRGLATKFRFGAVFLVTSWNLGF